MSSAGARLCCDAHIGLVLLHKMPLTFSSAAGNAAVGAGSGSSTLQAAQILWFISH